MIFHKIKGFITVAILVVLTYVAVYFVMSESYDHFGKYKIRQDGRDFRTNSYTTDSLGCIHFLDIKYNALTKETKTEEVTICGNYLISKTK